MTTSLATRVDRERLWRRHMLLARHGATPAGGVSRAALSAEEVAARRELIGWGEAIGLTPFTDPAGNLFLRYAGQDPAAAPAVYDNLMVSKGPSLGTNFTLCCPYTLLAHYTELEWAAKCGVRADLIRVSVGLEDIEDLKERFAKALAS